MLIGGIHRFSLIDYPGKISCIIFTPGCNFRCPYCHNPELVDPDRYRERVLPEVFFSFLRGRQGKLDGVVITGGEPTLQEDLPDFIVRIKAAGFLVKLDTNGSNPKMLASLLKEGLVDYVAMDIKAPLGKYTVASGVTDPEIIRNVEKSISILSKSGIEHEFRTTVVVGLLDEKDIMEIGVMIGKAKKYILQRFVASKTLHPDFENAAPFQENTLKALTKKLSAKGLKAIYR